MSKHQVLQLVCGLLLHCLLADSPPDTPQEILALMAKTLTPDKK